MFQRWHPYLLIVATLITLCIYVLFPWAENWKSMGVYEFLTAFEFLFSLLCIPLFLAIFCIVIVRILISEEALLARMVGRSISALLYGLVYGMFFIKYSVSFPSQMLSLHKSGIRMGTLWGLVMASLCFPFVGFFPLVRLFQSDDILLYILVCTVLIIFLSAMGELLQSFGIVKNTQVLVRKNIEVTIPLIHIPVFQISFVDRILRMMLQEWKYIFVPFFFALLFSSLLETFFDTFVIRSFFGNHFFGQIGVLFLTGLFPMYPFISWFFGVDILILHNGWGTFLTLISASFFWHFFLIDIEYQLFEKKWTYSFLLFFLFGSFIAGFFLNLVT